MGEKIAKLPEFLQVCAAIAVGIAGVCILIGACTASCTAVQWAEYNWPSPNSVEHKEIERRLKALEAPPVCIKKGDPRICADDKLAAKSES